MRSLDSLKGYAAEILIGTGYRPTIVLGLLEKYLRSKYRNAMDCSSEEIGKLAFNNYNNVSVITGCSQNEDAEFGISDTGHRVA